MLKAICKRCEYGKDLDAAVEPAQATPAPPTVHARKSIAPRQSYKRPPNADIIAAFGAAQRNIAGAAELLGVHRTTLYRWIEADPALAETIAGAARPATTYTAETPRDRAIVPVRTEVVTLHGRNFTVGWHEGATYWPVKPFVEAAGLSWQGQHQRIQGDARLAGSIKEMLMETPAGPRPMLCLPWAAWHYFWSGTHSPKAERWRQEAYDALRLVFGETAGKVLQEKPVAERVAAVGSRPPRALSDVLRRHPAFFRTFARLLDEAEEEERECERIKAEKAELVKQAQQRYEDAKRVMAEASAQKDDAIAAAGAAEERLRMARAKVEELIAQADELSGDEVQCVYFFGPPDYKDRMFVDGKVGDTINKVQKRKALRYGNPHHDFLTTRPCDDGAECASTILAYLCRCGAQQVGNDHFRNAPGYAVVHVLTVLEGMEYVTPDALSTRLNTRSAA